MSGQQSERLPNRNPLSLVKYEEIVSLKEGLLCLFQVISRYNVSNSVFFKVGPRL